MNTFLDTNYQLNGEKRRIGVDTKILCSDKVALEWIEQIKEQDCPSQIQEIIFRSFEDAEQEEDSYRIEVAESMITVYFSTQNSIRYGAAALVRHYEEGIPTGFLYNAPLCPFRAMKVYIPAKEQIPYFKEFIDMCAFYGYNTLVLEIGGAMEYKRHPEINEGWLEYCEIFKEYQAKSIDVQNSMPWLKNSIHWENGGGSFLTQMQLKDISDYCTKRGIEIIPEVPSLSHCDYMLTRHPELAENEKDVLADTFCPSNPGSYELLFDLLDEIVEVFHPRTVHIGHDEWYTIGVCEKCKGKDPARLYADDIIKIKTYLDQKGIETMIWGEKLLNAITKDGQACGGAERRVMKAPFRHKTVKYYGKEYPIYKRETDPQRVDLSRQVVIDIPATYHSIDMVPKDLKIMHWYYRFGFDEEYVNHDFWCVYGNFHGELMPDWFERVSKGMKGVSISNWGMVEKRYLQRNKIFYDMVYAAAMLWNRSFEHSKVKQNTLAVAKELFRYNYQKTLKQHYVEFIHTANLMIPRAYIGFFDGVLMDDDKDRLGYYHIHYKDGSSEKVDILLGSNIGYTPVDWDGSEKQLDRILGLDGHYIAEDGSPVHIGHRTNMLEATCTCDFVCRNKKIFYRFLYPITKEVDFVETEIFDCYKDVVFVDSIEVK